MFLLGSGLFSVCMHSLYRLPPRLGPVFPSIYNVYLPTPTSTVSAASLPPICHPSFVDDWLRSTNPRRNILLYHFHCIYIIIFAFPIPIAFLAPLRRSALRSPRPHGDSVLFTFCPLICPSHLLAPCYMYEIEISALAVMQEVPD